MSIEVRLPELGGSVSNAKLSIWLKNVGDPVKRGEPVAEVETDKTSVEIEAPGDGVLERIVVAAGRENVAIGDLLAVIDAGGRADARGAETTIRPDGPQLVPRPDSPLPRVEPVAAPAAGVPAPAASHAAAAAEPADSGAIAASPLARQMALVAGLPLAGIRGTGPGGKVMKSDIVARLGQPAVERARAARPAVRTPAPAAHESQGDYELEPLSAMRRVTAERLTQAKQEVPHFYLRVECVVDEVSRMREELNARTSDKISFTGFALRAAALALKKVPAANVMWVDGTVRRYRTVDIAVAVNTPSGLIAPIVRAADTKSVAVLNRELRDLAERARNGKLKPEDYSGGTCTISNLGMFGITSLYPIVNPPQACILGLGAVEERAVVRDHALQVGRMMTCTLSADHRALDGATGAELLSAFRQFIEDPWLLLL